MSKLEDRKPEELRAWFEESDIACELVAHVRASKDSLMAGMVSALRANEPIRGARHVGGYDELDKLLSILQRQPEKK